MEAGQLFGDALPPLTTVKKSEYAARIGVTPARVSQMITEGLPVEPNGRIDCAAADGWVRENVDPARRRIRFPGEAPPPPAPPPTPPPQAPAPPAPRPAPAGPGRGGALKDQLQEEQLAIKRLERGRLEGALVDRKAVEAAVFARARRERNAHMSFAAQAAPVIAAAAGCDAEVVRRELSALMRAHLDGLAATPLEDLTDAG